MKKNTHGSIANLSLIAFFQILFKILTYGVANLACINVHMSGVGWGGVVGWSLFLENIYIYLHELMTSSCLHLFLASFYGNQYFKSNFLGITLWCDITSGRNDCGQTFVFKLLYIQCFILFCTHQIRGL